jgi:hypothetical protein
MRSLKLLAGIGVGLAMVVAPSVARQSVASIGTLAAPQVAPSQASGLQVFLMTMGPGQYVYERFGHNAIWIRDTVAGADLVYNYGMFDFDAPGFVWNFVKARGMYRLEALDLPTTLAQYERFQRRLEVQELALSTAQKEQLAFLLAQNALPANREYRYDYFLDNCSTRIRDILDVVLGGALRLGSEGRPAEGTLRWHTQRSVSNNPGLYLGILAGLGSRVDQPIDQWTEMFLPAKVQERVRELRVVDDRGLEVPLVIRETTLLDINRFKVEPAQPNWSLPLFGVGALLALLIATGTLQGRAGIVGKVLAGAISVVLTVGGLVLLFLWLFTNHEMSRWNANVVLFSPIALSILMLLLRRGERVLTFLVTYGCAAAVAVGIVSFTPFALQDNRELAALIVPPFLAAALLALRLNRQRAATQPQQT